MPTCLHPVVLLTMGGLTVGQEYQGQFWSSDSYFMADSTGQTVLTAGSNSVALHNNTLNTYGAWAGG